MALGLTEEHRVLSDVVGKFVADQGGIAPARALLDRADETVPDFWGPLCDLGWVGLHLPEDVGGHGFGLAESAIVAEALARYVAPGPFLPTIVAGGVIDRLASEEVRHRRLPPLADGSGVGAFSLSTSVRLTGTEATGDGVLVLGGHLADLLVLPAGEDVILVDRRAPGVNVGAADGLDPSRRIVAVALDGVEVLPGHILAGGRAELERIARILASAEASGIAWACTAMATNYAKTREQFGRTIGSFQAVKHHCADMLVDAELATAASWGSTRADGVAEQRLAAAVGAAHALPAALRCAQTNIQILGGIGYTWEHDAHLFLRRAATAVAYFGAGTVVPTDVATLVFAGVRTRSTIDLPPEAEGFREAARSMRATLEGLTDEERRQAMIESGYLVPHFPRPFGRSAGPVEQLAIDEELGDIEGPDLGIGTWILPTLIQFGSETQVEQWIRPSLRGELRWCQLFSEPEAGSDAAAIRCRARPVDGGWLVTGQKVWTSDAAHCNRGLATVRTDPDAAKHAGVTVMVVDMDAPGVDVRPLRDITGQAIFNEVFLDDVFVPDEQVVGEVGAGWSVARATLGNERITIGRGVGMPGYSAYALVDQARRHAADDGGLFRQIGALVAEEEAMRLLNLRQVTRALAGEGSAAEGNITKLLSAEHAQRATELGLRTAGAAAATGEEPELLRQLLFTRCLTIAGGTSEITRSQIAERLLGLPRDMASR